MTAPSDATHLGLSWPEAYADILPVLRREWGVEDKIYLTRQLGGGRSGAPVFFVDIATKTYTGQAILKLDRVSNPRDQEKHEAALHDRAIADAPKFAAKHLPRLLHTAHNGEHVAILSTIAGRGLEYVEPWIECSYDRKLESIRKVSTGLLEDWNRDYRLGEDLKMPQELLRDWLGYRVEPAQGGRIHSLLDEACGIYSETPSIIFDGHWYPNPLAFLESGDVPERTRLRGVLGHCHGDFHGFNLLVRRKEKKALEYYLIDLEMYESEQFLFCDHAYFELANLLHFRGQATGRDWEAIVAQLCRYPLKDELPELKTDDIGLIELVQALRQGAMDWIERHEPERLSFMESQMLLARVAVGLTFAHRKMPLPARQRAFFYAAANLKDYIKLQRLAWPKTGPVFEIGTKTSSAADERTPAKTATTPTHAVVAEHAAAPTQRRSKLPLFVALGVGAVCLAALLVGLGRPGTLWFSNDNLTRTETPGPVATAFDSSVAEVPKTSLAIMPFKNLNADGDDSFVDGLSIDIAFVFAQTGAFRMPGTTSSFRFKGNLDDTRAIGEALNVDYLVEGTVRRDGDDLRIAVSLVRAKDDFLIWSQTFNEKLDNVFVTQERVADAIGEALATPLDIDADVLRAQRTDDPRAYDLFVRGLALYQQRVRLEEAAGMLRRAVALNPDFAAAWGALSLVLKSIPDYQNKTDGRVVDPTAYYAESTDAALKAKEIDFGLPLVRYAVAAMYERKRQWLVAQDEYEAALRDQHTMTSVMLDYSTLLYIVGKWSDSLAWLDRARKLDPSDPQYRLWDDALRSQINPTEEVIKSLEEIFRRYKALRAFALRYILDYRAQAGELEEARELVKACRDCSVDFQDRTLAMLDAASTKPARDVFEEYKDDNFVGYGFLYSIGGLDIVLDAFQYYALDAKRRYGYMAIPWALVDKLNHDKLFLDIVDQMGVSAYWRERGYPDGCTITDEDLLSCDGGGS